MWFLLLIFLLEPVSPPPVSEDVFDFDVDTVLDDLIAEKDPFLSFEEVDASLQCLANGANSLFTLDSAPASTLKRKHDDDDQLEPLDLSLPKKSC